VWNMALDILENDPLLHEDEAAVELHRHSRTLKRWRDLGEGPAYVRIGREVLYRRSAIRQWLLAREVQPGAAA
jgi:predicted DNA-binding transcriptional regulator AlpA